MMRIKSKHVVSCNPDMTPMIDLTFQLTFFFMLALNFSSDVQSDLIRLPLSDVAKPAEGALLSPITIQAMASGLVLFGGDIMTVGGLQEPLQREKAFLKAVWRKNAGDATVIIRADRDVPSGKVKEVIHVCQQTGFEKFVLRVRPSMK